MGALAITVGQFVGSNPNTFTRSVPANAPSLDEAFFIIGAFCAYVIALHFGLISIGLSWHVRDKRRTQEAKLAVHEDARRQAVFHGLTVPITGMLGWDRAAEPVVANLIRNTNQFHWSRCWVVVRNASYHGDCALKISPWFLDLSGPAQISDLVAGVIEGIGVTNRPGNDVARMEEMATVRFRTGRMLAQSGISRAGHSYSCNMNQPIKEVVWRTRRLRRQGGSGLGPEGEECVAGRPPL